MPDFDIREVDGRSHLVAWKIHRLNRAHGHVFPELSDRHLREGFWWFALHRSNVVGFAGMVEHLPGTNAKIGFLKRAYVVPSARGNGLQRLLMASREAKARLIGWTHLLSETPAGHIHSINNHIACGFKQLDPDQPWSGPNTIYWFKQL